MKYFELGDVVAVYTGILLKSGGMDGIYKVLNYLTGEKLYTHQLPRAAREVKKGLTEQLPFLNSPEFDFAVGRLKEMLESESGKKEPEQLCMGWLIKQQSLYGEMVKLSSLTSRYTAKNPILELLEKFNPKGA